MATSTIKGRKSISPTITSTTGTITADGYQAGNVAHIVLHAKNTSAVDAGSNIASGTIEEAYRPAAAVSGCTFNQARPIIANISGEGAIVVRNAGTSALAANQQANIPITYLINA